MRHIWKRIIKYWRRRRRKRFYRRFLKPDDLAFDIGANVGERTELMLRTGARVVCVEPLEECCERLRERFGNNERVIFVPAGVDEAEGEREIYFSREATTVSSMSEEWIEAIRANSRLRHASFNWGERRVVPVTTLDCLIEQYGEPRFCKIDVEGYESQVLMGLSRSLRAISFEYNPEYMDCALACLERLEELGDGHYRFNYSEGETMQMALGRWVGLEEMRRVLESLRGGEMYGDVYARRKR